jgi:CO/xanthine dehydrogenase FAD-binding subunit
VVEATEAGGRMLDDGLIERIARDAASRIECRADLQGSADYRRHLAFVLGKRTLAAVRSGEVVA